MSFDRQKHFKEALGVILFTLISISQTSFVFAQAPVTTKDFKNILGQAAKTAEALEKVDATEAQIDQQGTIWKQHFDIHNANKCTYPEGQPEVCDAYDQEAAELNKEAKRIQAALDENDSQRKMLNDQLRMFRTRLRAAIAMAPLTCACHSLDAEEESACWSACFDGANPNLISCLGINDLDAFRACLAG